MGCRASATLHTGCPNRKRRSLGNTRVAFSLLSALPVLPDAGTSSHVAQLRPRDGMAWRMVLVRSKQTTKRREGGEHGAETRPSAAEGEAEGAGDRGLIDFDQIDQGKVISPPPPPLSLSLSLPLPLHHRFNDDDDERPLLDLHITSITDTFLWISSSPTTLRQPDWPIISTTHSLARYRHHIPLYSTRPHRSHSLTPQQIALPKYILTSLQDETTIDIKNQTTTARPLDIVHYVS
jgi:hypothetical protein